MAIRPSIFGTWFREPENDAVWKSMEPKTQKKSATINKVYRGLVSISTFFPFSLSCFLPIYTILSITFQKQKKPWLPCQGFSGLKNFERLAQDVELGHFP